MIKTAKIKRDVEYQRRTRPQCNLDFIFSDDVRDWYGTSRKSTREKLNEIREENI